MTRHTALDSWFLHEPLTFELIDPRVVSEVQQNLPSPADPMHRGFRRDALQRVMADWLAHNRVDSLEVACTRDALTSGRLVWYEGPVYFRDVAKAHASITRKEVRASLKAKIPSSPAVSLSASFSARHLTSSTSITELKGLRRVYILGYVKEAGNTDISLRVILLANRWQAPNSHTPGGSFLDARRVYPQAIDQFSGIDFTKRLTQKDLDALKSVPENTVKHAFAHIIGEPDVPKDWGGEQYDLWTSQLRISNSPASAAFLFKGPAKFTPMTIAHLGKNGDQIDRLGSSPAELLVVQHCHKITSPVINLVKAYASDMRNPRRYMILDGYDTLRILSHHGYL